ncbi:lysine-specific histone demethylase 1B [Diaphorina citri]|uniref:Lysine-specific histone demethylase 1B n=1 Tax=Diaphorina citri TaxID=121845 RepID=A0A3Q0IUM2_DIACI|nr:lysine-specific histone demethylase 1B [Diaphorina citri]
MKKQALIIVGAGASGIAAATRLVSKGVEDFIILEAEDRIGGRIHTIPFEGNTFIDIGAQWVHGQKGNVVYEMAKEFDLVEDDYPDFFQSISVNSSGAPINREHSVQLFEAIKNILSDENEDITKYNGSLGEYVSEKLQSRLTNHTTLSHLVSSPLYNQVLEFFGKFQNSIDGTDSWFQTSARSYPSYEQFEGCPTTIWKKGGYNNALKLLMSTSLSLISLKTS